MKRANPATEDYKRSLSGEELLAIGADEESLAEERAGLLAAQHEARLRFFGLAPAPAAGAMTECGCAGEGEAPSQEMPLGWGEGVRPCPESTGPTAEKEEVEKRE